MDRVNRLATKIRRLVVLLGAQASLSASMMLISMATSRAGGIEALGHLGVSIAILLFVREVIVDATLTPLLSSRNIHRDIPTAAGRAGLLAVCAATIIALVSVLVSSPYLLIIGLTLPGLIRQALVRIFDITHGRGIRGAISEVLPLLSTFTILLLQDLLGTPAWTALLVWSMACALLGTVNVLTLGWRIWSPLSVRARNEGRIGLDFGIQTALTQGGLHITTVALPSVASMATIGVIRGGGTFFGPLNMAIAALKPLMVKSLSSRISGTVAEKRFALAKLGLLLASFYAVTGGILISVSSTIGPFMFGDSWDHIRPYIWLFLIDGVLSITALIPVSYLRSRLVGKDAVQIALKVAVLRLACVLPLAAFYGPSGAIFALVAIAIISVSWWWIAAFRVCSIS